MEKNILSGIVDIHIHTMPDIRVRRLSDIELAKIAKENGAEAIVIKSHLVPTASRARIAEEVVPEVKVFGGIVLNPHIGGLNPLAVETSLKLGGKFVWLPTSFSKKERELQGKNDGVEVVKDGKVLENLEKILQLIKEHDAILATGHLSEEELLIVVKRASEIGIKKIVINHPEWPSVNLSIDFQRELMQYGVFFERCYARNIKGQYYKNLDINVEAIRALGVETTIIATDGGQTENPIWNEAYAEIIIGLKENGFTDEEIDIMTKINPKKVLGI